MKRLSALLNILIFSEVVLLAETFEPIKFGNFDSWLTRNIKESSLLGGNTRQVYEICPTGTDSSGKPYTNRGGSPWGTSNVLASPSHITKTSNAVYPENRPGNGKCARLTCQFEHVKVLGIINMDVVVGGSIFTGEMIEPVKSTKNAYSNMDMGMPLTRRPKALQFDYKVNIPATNERVKSTGFGKKTTLPGSDHAEALIYLQHRWEDKDGNLFARRVGTARQQYKSSTQGWINAHQMPIIYGDATKSAAYNASMNLIPAAKSYYARNSKGKMVPVTEVGWGAPDEAPTHAIIMFSAAGGEPFIGTLGLTLWVDNVGLVY